MSKKVIHKIKSDKGKKHIDRLMYFAAFAQPMSSVPQVAQIYLNHQAQGVSLFTWIAFLMFAVLFLVHGIANEIKPIIAMQSLWVMIDVLIVTGIILYG